MSNNPEPPKDYEVGYGRPPKQHQFPPGRSGNVSGGTKRQQKEERNLMALLDRPVPVRDGGRETTMSPKEVTLRTLAQKAFAGDRKSLFRLVDLFLQHDGFPASSHGRVNFVLALSTERMPFPMALIMALHFGHQEHYTPQQLAIGRAEYIAQRSDIQAKIDADIGYPDLEPGDER